jgi:hypothetical protein
MGPWWGADNARRDPLTYGFANDDEVARYLSTLCTFENNKVHFWPSFAESVAHADKLAQAHRLDDIAARITRSPRPTTTGITLKKAKTATGVLKRSFSDRSSHVLVLPRDKARVVKCLEKPCSGLLLQTHVPTLVSHGELRVGISYGRIIWRVWTRPLGGGEVEFYDLLHQGKILNVPMRYSSHITIMLRGPTLHHAGTCR